MGYRRIVIGVDFSTASLDAVRWVATELAPRAQLFLAHVVAQPRVPSFLRPHVADARDQDSDETTLYPGLSGFAGLAGAALADVSIRRGQPADELAAVARDVDADLVCVGRSQRRRGTGRFGATTPQRLLARTSRSVLLVPRGTRGRPRSVLAAMSDGSEAQDVLRATARLAEGWDARVDLLHALDAHDDASLRELAEAWLARRAEEIPGLDKRTNAIGGTGDAAQAILTQAAHAHSDFIVMGRRTVVEHSEAFDACVGSTTRLITWTTPCPVLVVGAPSSDRSRLDWKVSQRATTPGRTHSRDERPFGRRRGDPAHRGDGGDAA